MIGLIVVLVFGKLNLLIGCFWMLFEFVGGGDCRNKVGFLSYDYFLGLDRGFFFLFFCKV